MARTVSERDAAFPIMAEGACGPLIKTSKLKGSTGYIVYAIKIPHLESFPWHSRWSSASIEWWRAVRLFIIIEPLLASKKNHFSWYLKRHSKLCHFHKNREIFWSKKSFLTFREKQNWFEKKREYLFTHTRIFAPKNQPQIAFLPIALLLEVDSK